MPQPPRYVREKNFTLDLGNKTDHSALNAEFDSAANSINDIRTNLAILQADDGKLRPSVVTSDSISPELRVSLVEGVIIDAQDMLNQSQAAAAAAEAAKIDAASSSSTASSFAAVSATKANEASASASQAAASAASINPASLIHATGNETKAGVLTLTDGLVTSSVNGGQLAGLRNKVINGDMIVCQRAAPFSIIAGTTQYTLDRWYAANITTGAYTVTQSYDAPTDSSGHSLMVTVNTADAAIAANEYAFIRQNIEGYFVRRLIGKPIAISFKVRSSKTGIHCVAIKNVGGDRSYVCEYVVNTANTWEYKIVFVPAGLITAGTWNWTNGIGLRLDFTLCAGSSLQTTKDVWQTGAFLATANQVNCLDAVGNIFAITDIQLEQATVATPFEQRYYGLELLMCQRYYERVPNCWFATGNAFINIQLVKKRINPNVVVTYSSGTGQTASGFAEMISIGDMTANTAVTSFTATAEL